MQIIISQSGGGGGASIPTRTGTQGISSAAQSVTVVFTSNMSSNAYALVTSITNTTDSSPIFLQIVDTVKSNSGFTAIFNAPTDTANYSLEYVAIAAT